MSQDFSRQAVNELTALHALRGQRLMGLDLGTKTIGIAISSSNWQISTPLCTIRRKKFTLDVSKIEQLIIERSIKGLVFGLPLNMDASEGARAQATRAFVRNWQNKLALALPVAFWDERLSTQIMERELIEQMDRSRAKRAQIIDQLAAGYILQGALDSLHQSLGQA